MKYCYWCNDCHEWAWKPAETKLELENEHKERLKQAENPEKIHNVEIREYPIVL